MFCLNIYIYIYIYIYYFFFLLLTIVYIFFSLYFSIDFFSIFSSYFPQSIVCIIILLKYHWSSHYDVSLQGCGIAINVPRLMETEWLFSYSICRYKNPFNSDDTFIQKGKLSNGCIMKNISRMTFNAKKQNIPSYSSHYAPYKHSSSGLKPIPLLPFHPLKVKCDICTEISFHYH